MTDNRETSLVAERAFVPYPNQLFGPVILENGTHFQIWAPDAAEVFFAPCDSTPVPLQRDTDGFWRGTLPIGPGALYKFEIDGASVPDPASRFQPKDVNGPSQLVDSANYVWRHSGWQGRKWEETVLYEIHPGVWGGFDGIRKRLPALMDLGITAIELMPIADFAGERNWGYDGVLPFAPDSSYGTPDALRALIDEAHGLGLMVFLDVVYNHFGPEGNFLPIYASGLFDPGTPTPWGPAIEYANPIVRKLFTENALYWLKQFRVDGLRLDAVHAIKDRSWLRELAEQVNTQCAGRHVHLVLENENNDADLLTQGFTAQWNDDFHNVMHVILTGETHSYYADFAAEPMQQLARCLSQGFVYQGDRPMNRNGHVRGQPSAHLPPTSFVTFLQNHDQTGNRAFGDRLTTLVPTQALRAAMALMALTPQIPMLFMGEECGAVEPFLFFTDFHGELGAAVRDGRRREFANDPAFSEATNRSEIPDPNDPATFAASVYAETGAAAAEWRSFVKTLLAHRRRLITPYLASTAAIGAEVVGTKAVLARWQLGNGSTLAIATNFSESPASAQIPQESPSYGNLETNAHIPPFSTIAWILP